MKSQFVPINLMQFIEENRDQLKPPVNNKVIWKDAELMVMLLGGPNKRRDFHVDPSEEVFYQIQGSCYVEVINAEGKREVVDGKGRRNVSSSCERSAFSASCGRTRSDLLSNATVQKVNLRTLFGSVMSATMKCTVPRFN